jgi:hypothetical protein
MSAVPPQLQKWHKHVKSVQKKDKNLTLKEAMVVAKKTYKKKQQKNQQRGGNLEAEMLNVWNQIHLNYPNLNEQERVRFFYNSFPGKLKQVRAFFNRGGYLGFAPRVNNPPRYGIHRDWNDPYTQFDQPKKPTAGWRKF